MAKRIRWDEAASAGKNACAELPSMAASYFQAGRKMLRASRRPAELHAFRLKTKRLRYTLELFRACYGPSLEQRIEALKEVQTLLGEINDCASALRTAEQAMSTRSPQYKKLRRFLNARAARLAAGFRKHWQERFDAAGREDWWLAYLGRKRS